MSNAPAGSSHPPPPPPPPSLLDTSFAQDSDPQPSSTLTSPLPPHTPASQSALGDLHDQSRAESSSHRSIRSPIATGSFGAVQASTSSSSARDLGVAAGADEDIEMEPLHGHRRRKSSLMNPVGHDGSNLAPGRPKPTSGRAHGHRMGHSQSVSLKDEPKILEEDSLDDPSFSNSDRPRDSFSDEDLHDDEETGLTDKERRRKQKKRQRNTMLDNRVVREKHMSPDQRKEADKSVVKRLLVNAGLIFLWYLFSLSISLYNKWMFDEDRLNFAFPLFTTSFHMLVQLALAALVLFLIPRFRPSHGRNSDMGRSRHETEPSNSIMSKMFYLTRIGPCGAATGLDIGLGNTSLKFVSLTFYTMCKSSSLAFVLIFAFIFRLETPTFRLVTIIAFMTLGVVLMVFGEVEFKLGGFFLVISAALFSGLRWSLTQILLLRHPATSNPFSSILFITPVMFVVLFGLAIPIEGFGPLGEGLGVLNAEWGPVLTPLFLLIPGCIAFLMTASEFALLQRTSVVTLSIAGIFKEVVTISAASVVFEDKLTTINVIGLIVTLVAIVAYNYIKITKMRNEAQTDRDEDIIEPAAAFQLTDTSSSDDDDDAPGEAVGLLPTTNNMDPPLVTGDGDIQTNFFPMSPPSASDSRKEHL